MGRHSKEIDPNAPGAPVGTFLRQLQEEAGLPWREIAKVAHIGYSTLSQNADGRLTKKPDPICAWFDALYQAVEYYDIDMSMSKEEALKEALNLWKECHRYQRQLNRKRATVPQPPGVVADQPGDVEDHPDAPASASAGPADASSPVSTTPVILPVVLPCERPVEPRTQPEQAGPRPPWARRPGVVGIRERREQPTGTFPRRSRHARRVDKPTILLPGVPGRSDRHTRVTPASLFQAANVSDLVAALNDMLNDAGYDVSMLVRQGRLGVEPVLRFGYRLDGQARDVLTGQLPPTPGIIRRLVLACGGSPGDCDTWKEIAYPILERLPAHGRAQVNPPSDRPVLARGEDPLTPSAGRSRLARPPGNS